MQTFCLICKKSADNIASKKVAMAMTKKVIIDKSRCAICRTDKSKFLEYKCNEKPDKKGSRNKYQP